MPRHFPVASRALTLSGVSMATTRPGGAGGGDGGGDGGGGGFGGEGCEGGKGGGDGGRGATGGKGGGGRRWSVQCVAYRATRKDSRETFRALV